MGFRENIASDEVERFERYAAELGKLQAARAKTAGTTLRALHVKPHLGVVGELEVSSSGPSRAGVFSGLARAWPAYVRFSNGSGVRQADGIPDLRGLAVKLVGVPGPKILPGLEQELTQDFLFINEPAVPFRNPDEFLAFLRAASGPKGLLLPRLLLGTGPVRSAAILWHLARMKPVSSFATHVFHTAAPVALGETAARLALFPIGNPAPAPTAAGDGYLRDDLTARLQAQSVSWSLCAQLFIDDESTPIENAAVPWTGPWIELGTLRLPRQDPASPEGQALSDYVNELSFDPWHAIREHRPLGAMMRARAAAYRVSSQQRRAAPEPRDVPELARLIRAARSAASS